MPTLARLWKGGESTTVDLLGEKVVNEGEARRYVDRLIELIDVLIVGTTEWPSRDQFERDPWGDVRASTCR